MERLFTHTSRALVQLFAVTVLMMPPRTGAQTTAPYSETVVLSGESQPSFIDSVNIAGAEKAFADSLAPLLLSKQDGILNEGFLAHDRGVIETIYRERGFWRARTDAAVDSGAAGISVTFHIDPGVQTVLGTVAVTG